VCTRRRSVPCKGGFQVVYLSFHWLVEFVCVCVRTKTNCREREGGMEWGGVHEKVRRVGALRAYV